MCKRLTGQFGGGNFGDNVFKTVVPVIRLVIVIACCTLYSAHSVHMYICIWVFYISTVYNSITLSCRIFIKLTPFFSVIFVGSLLTLLIYIFYTVQGVVLCTPIQRFKHYNFHKVLGTQHKLVKCSLKKETFWNLTDKLTLTLAWPTG